ncbi:helix-turn-helix transcriptional regulator [Magnetococcales bacterium HHB-1]
MSPEELLLQDLITVARYTTVNAGDRQDVLKALQRIIDTFCTNNALPNNNKLCVRNNKAAELLGVRPQTLAKWRTEGTGPPFIKMGKTVVYQISALKEWLQANTTQSTKN